MFPTFGRVIRENTRVTYGYACFFVHVASFVSIPFRLVFGSAKTFISFVDRSHKLGVSLVGKTTLEIQYYFLPVKIESGLHVSSEYTTESAVL